MERIITDISNRCDEALNSGLVPFQGVRKEKREAIILYVKLSNAIGGKISNKEFSTEWHHIKVNNKWEKLYLFNENFSDCYTENEIQEFVVMMKWYYGYIKRLLKIAQKNGVGRYPTPETDTLYRFLNDQKFKIRDFLDRNWWKLY